jgi:hypothetical protein
VGDRQDNDGDRRSRSKLDPAAGVRALADVERHGLRAANELVDRLIHSIDGNGDGDGESRDTNASAATSGHDAAASSAVGLTDNLVRLWAELVRLGLDTFGQLVSPGGPSQTDDGRRGATLDIATGASTGVVRIGVVPPTPSSDRGTTSHAETAETEVWLHNGSSAEYIDIALHCGDLRASDGVVLPAASVRFNPAVVDLPARSSRGVAISVRAGAPPGTYRGVVLATGVPEAWLPIEVVVAAADQHTG